MLMLTTNLIRKDINSTQLYECGVAMGGLGCFINTDLARDLVNDIVSLVSTISSSVGIYCVGVKD